jgi:hypothetical protein
MIHLNQMESDSLVNLDRIKILSWIRRESLLIRDQEILLESVNLWFTNSWIWFRFPESGNISDSEWIRNLILSWSEIKRRIWFTLDQRSREIQESRENQDSILNQIQVNHSDSLIQIHSESVSDSEIFWFRKPESDSEWISKSLIY